MKNRFYPPRSSTSRWRHQSSLSSTARRPLITLTALALVALSAANASAGRHPTKTQQIISNYSGYDKDGDGIDEINQITAPAFENLARSLPSTGRTVVFFGEPRLLNDLPTGYRAYDFL